MAKIGKVTYFEERESLDRMGNFGTLGRGDVTSWAKGVSKPWGSVHKPKRPECSGEVLFKTGSASEPMVISHPHNSSQVVMPTKGKTTVDLSDGNKIDELMAARSRKRLLNAHNFANLYSGKIALKGEVKEYV